jgi:UDP-N-acetylglucosamine--N-acetylmuramyl-(pentapeptide) pyrophosphoryl-undecaprenol N-acetylglucosamine transferase
VKIIFAGGGTGGHLYPGLAIARALVRRDPAIEPFFIGAKRGIERDVLPGTEFPHALLDLHPLYRSRPWDNWRTIRGAATAWRQIGRQLRFKRPPLVVGTGGYAAGLVLAYAAMHGRPYVLQEQNSHPGLTMRAFSRWAREVYLGFPEAAAALPHGSRTTMVDSGNPIEPPPSPRPDRQRARAQWEFAPGGRVLLIVGGSQGARTVNDVVAAWVRAGVPAGWQVIWATGKGSFAQYASLESDRVRVRPYLAPIADAYAATDLALCRAGAMTTAELCAWGIPSVLVPLPTAAADHQTSNARALEAAGASLFLSQTEFTPARIDATLARLDREPATLASLAASAAARGRPDAAETIARRILTLLDVKQIRS